MRIGNGFAAGVLVALLISSSAMAAKFYVSPSGNDNPGNGSIGAPYRTIQKGITIANAGDSVMVQPGTYNGSIVMEDGVAIIGSGYETTIIDGNSATAIVTAATALIQGFTIRDGETAILYDGNSSVAVHSNFITECYYGIDGWLGRKFKFSDIAEIGDLDARNVHKLKMENTKRIAITFASTRCTISIELIHFSFFQTGCV